MVQRNLMFVWVCNPLMQTLASTCDWALNILLYISILIFYSNIYIYYYYELIWVFQKARSEIFGGIYLNRLILLTR